MPGDLLPSDIPTVFPDGYQVTYADGSPLQAGAMCVVLRLDALSGSPGAAIDAVEFLVARLRGWAPETATKLQGLVSASRAKADPRQWEIADVGVVGACHPTWAGCYDLAGRDRLLIGESKSIGFAKTDGTDGLVMRRVFRSS